MRNILAILLLFIAILTGTAVAQTATESQTIAYTDTDGTQLEGYVARPARTGGGHPVIIMVADWMGLGAQIKEKADKLAGQGYIAFCADIYGKGVRPANMSEASAQATKYKSNIPLMRSRVQAALATALKQPGARADRVIGMGYCFGGTVALELARSGAAVVGTVSFHGGLANATPADAQNIKGKVLVLHGAIDPYVPKKEVDTFIDEMNAAGVDYQFIAYSGAVHAFTNPAAGTDITKGAAYNEAADRRSWQAFMQFLAEVGR